VAASERGIHVYDVRTGKRLLDLKGHHSRVQQVQFSPDGRRLLSVGMEGAVKLWDSESGQELLTLTDAAGRFQGAAFSPDGHLLAVSVATVR